MKSLSESGIRIVPTQFLERGLDWIKIKPLFIEFGVDKLVIKPQIGAGTPPSDGFYYFIFLGTNFAHHFYFLGEAD